jgi:hypothetical protein
MWTSIAATVRGWRTALQEMRKWPPSMSPRISAFRARPVLGLSISGGGFEEVGTDRSTFAVISLWGKFGGLHACGSTFSHMVPLPSIFLTHLFSKLGLKRKDFPEIVRLTWAHRTRLQRLPFLLLTANVSNKSDWICFSLKVCTTKLNPGVHSTLLKQEAIPHAAIPN